MNLSVEDIEGEITLYFSFTLTRTQEGNRPAFTGAAKPDMASNFMMHSIKSSARRACSDRYLWSGYAELSWCGPVTIITIRKIVKNQAD